MKKIRKIVAFLGAATVICLTFAIPCLAYGGYSSSNNLSPSSLYCPWIPWNIAIKKSSFDSYWVFPDILKCTSDFAGGATVGYPDGLATWRYGESLGISTPTLEVRPFQWYDTGRTENGVIYTDLYASDFVIPSSNRLSGSSLTYYFRTDDFSALDLLSLCLVVYAEIPVSTHTVVARLPLSSTVRPVGSWLDYSISFTYSDIRSAIYNIPAVGQEYNDEDPIFIKNMCIAVGASSFSNPSGYNLDIGDHIFHPGGNSIVAVPVSSLVPVSDYNSVASSYYSDASYSEGWFAGYDYGYGIGLEEGRADPLEKIDFGKPIANSVTSILSTKLFDIPLNDNVVPLTIGGILLLVFTVSLIPVIIKLFSS